MKKESLQKIDKNSKVRRILIISIVLLLLLIKSVYATESRKMEMKDIEKVTLYNKNGEAISSVELADLSNLDNYLVKIDMKNLPSFYSKIRSYRAEEKLTFVLDYDGLVQYNGDQKQGYLEVEYGTIENGVAKNLDINDYIQMISANSSGTYKLTADLDASNITAGSYIFAENFSGTINGNGHKIINLSRPLFQTLSGATIENLVIENSNMTANGTIAITATGTTLKNVHITNAKMSASNDNGSGVLFGIAQNKCLIENCSATNINMAGRKRSGIMIGKMSDTTMRNCYVTGSISSGSDAAGGMIGETVTTASTMENCYANVKTNFSWESGSIGGMIGNPGTVKLVNSLSLSTTIKTDGKAHGMRIFGSYNGSKINANSSNNFELETSNMGSNSSHTAVSTVSEETVRTSEFYKNTLGWNNEIWDLDNIGKDSYPTLRGADPNYQGNIAVIPNNKDVYIPDYARLRNLANFDNNKEIAYHNLYKLMPFYDSDYLVEDGAKLSNHHILNTKIINQVLPFDENGKLIVGLSQENKASIKTIKVLFKDDSTVSYPVTYKDSSAMIVNYTINELGIGYNYNKYLIDTTSKSYSQIVSKVKAYDYNTDIASLTEETEVRNYVNNYPHVQELAEQFALDFLANNGDFTISSATNTLLDNKICQDLEANNTLKKVLYTYNYFDRFYNIEIGGINMRDIVFFDGSIFSKELNSMKMTEIMMATTSNYRQTTVLDGYYNTYIKSYTGKSLGLFLEYFMQNLTEEKYRNDPASWIIDNFEGIIYEKQGENKASVVRYRVWDHMKVRELLILPILSYHGEDMYVLGVPSVILVGDIKEYFPTQIDNIKYEDATYEQKMGKLKNFADNACNFFSTILNIVDDNTVTRTATKSHISYDRAVYQANPTNPVLIGLNEVINRWFTMPTSAASAYANGTDIYWNYHCLNFYAIFTHETVHNQDGYLFLEGTGRRSGAGGEMFTDGFLTQGIGAYGVLPNYTWNKNITDDISVNLTVERINSREKIHDYYKKMFEVYEILEYLEGKAFLQLTPKEQSQIARKAVDSGYSTSFLRLSYQELSEQEFKEMNLSSIEDLWDNNLVAIRGNSGYTGGSNWYIGNYDKGLTETVFKTLAYKMLGDFGYDGYVSYAGGRYKTDLDIIRGITGDDTMTWKQYQMNQYAEIESKLSKIKYFNADELVEEMVTAMKKDVANGTPVSDSGNEGTLRKVLYGYIKRATNDFRSSVYEELPNVIHVSSEEELLEVLQNNINANIVLDTDLDFANIDYTTIDKTVTVTIDGNGHTIKGLKQPLINTMIYTEVKNLIIEDTLDTGTAIAKKMQLGRIEDVTLESGKVNQAGGIAQTIDRVSTQNVEIIEREIEIRSLDDFLKIGNTTDYPEYRLDKIYKITNNIDFLNYTASSDAIITGTFSGKIKGEGHTLSNLRDSALFADFRGQVQDLNIENFTNEKGGDMVAAFTKQAYGATFKNMNFKNITLKGTHRVAVVTGTETKNAGCVYERISVENAKVVGSGVYVSAFVGRKYGGSIKNCYVEGNLECYTTECGGVSGALHQSVLIENVVAKVNVNRPRSTDSRNQNGGLVGNIIDTSTIKNCISLGNMTGFTQDGNEINVNKFIGCSEAKIISCVQNCYEIKEKTGTTSSTDATKEYLKVVSRSSLKDNFYKDDLHFDQSIWNYNTIPTLGHPVLNEKEVTVPTATVSYSTTELTNQDVVATITFNEEVTIKNKDIALTKQTDGSYQYVFTKNGNFEIVFENKAGIEGRTNLAVDWIDKEAPTATVSYSTTELTNQDVVATITFNEEVTIKNKDIALTKQADGTYQYIFNQNDDFELIFEDQAGNESRTNLAVDWIDKETPTARIEYSTEVATKEPVVAKLICDEEITITNNDGKDTYTFTENGSFEFIYADQAGNEGRITATVSWIEEEMTPTPTPGLIVKVVYDIKEPTNQDVVATLESNEEITITNNDGKDTYTFTENGSFEFVYEDKDGNEGRITAKVSWIDKEAPTAEILYSTTELTNKDVVVTLNSKEDIIVTNNNGSKTHIFTENGEFVFEFKDKAGNTNTAKASVSWIKKTIPMARIEYSIQNITKESVVAKLVSDEEITITNNDGKDTYTFTKNGSFEFIYADKAGNEGKIVATVSWIDKDAPVATVSYSTTEPTSQKVEATLNCDEDIIVMNNNGNKTYTFTKNGEFVFEFKDKAGNTNTAKASVDWIRKMAPIAHIEYSTNKQTEKPVVAKLVCDEEITITNNGGSDTYTFTKNGSFEFVYTDKEGNEGRTKASVSWIKEKQVSKPNEPTDSKPENPKPNEPSKPAESASDKQSQTNTINDKYAGTVTYLDRKPEKDNNSQNDLTRKGKLPFTGMIRENTWILYVGVMVIMLAVYFFVRIKLLNYKMKK